MHKLPAVSYRWYLLILSAWLHSPPTHVDIFPSTALPSTCVFQDTSALAVFSCPPLRITVLCLLRPHPFFPFSFYVPRRNYATTFLYSIVLQSVYSCLLQECYSRHMLKKILLISLISTSSLCLYISTHLSSMICHVVLIKNLLNSAIRSQVR